LTYGVFVRHCEVDVTESNAFIKALKPWARRVSEARHVANLILTSECNEFLHKASSDAFSLNLGMYSNIGHLRMPEVARQEPDANKNALAISRSGDA